MTEFQENSSVLTREYITSDVVRLTVQAPHIAAAAQPGQFAMIRTGETLDPLLRRPFSIHNASDGTISFLFKIIGKGTRLLAEFTPGRRMDIIGPLGRGFNLAPDGPFCLIGGGMGIAPLYFLARHLLHQRRRNNPPVLLGAQTQAELLPLAEDFIELGYPVHTATDDGTLGHHGFVTELLLDDILRTVAQVYVCGPLPMMQKVALRCLEAGVACQASLETHMACGLGACLGCTFPATGGGHKHICKDGPVFSAEEVIWNR